MNTVSLRKSNFMDYKVYIFDLDGTLYYQKPFRIRMLYTLIKYVLKHPLSLRKLFWIKKYREIREHWDKCENDFCFDNGLSLDERQYAYVAAKEHVTPQQVEQAVKLFMLELPLSVLLPYRDEILADMIKKLKSNKKTVVIYSDYPVESKLACLGIEADACYTSGDRRIGCMKPEPKGIHVILEELGCDSADAVMIGDRFEKDGLAAQKNDVDYIIVSSSKKERAKLSDIYMKVG